MFMFLAHPIYLLLLLLLFCFCNPPTSVQVSIIVVYCVICIRFHYCGIPIRSNTMMLQYKYVSHK